MCRIIEVRRDLLRWKVDEWSGKSPFRVYLGAIMSGNTFPLSPGICEICTWLFSSLFRQLWYDFWHCTIKYKKVIYILYGQNGWWGMDSSCVINYIRLIVFLHLWISQKLTLGSSRFWNKRATFSNATRNFVFLR